MTEDLPDPTATDSELSALAGRGVRWTATSLTHNRLNATTRGIWRVVHDAGSAVLKVVSGGRETGDAQWSSSAEPSHWNYWRREPLVYQHSLPLLWQGSGIGAPRLLGLFDREGGDLAMWLEDVEGLAGRAWDPAQHERFARMLGRAQGRVAAAAALPEQPWLTRTFLRDYVESKRVDHGLVDDEAAWRHPLIREHWPPELRVATRRLHAMRDRLLQLVESSPRTLCHLDVWPANEIARPDGSVALVDWSFAGLGALGEDAGNHVPDSVFDLFLPASLLPELDRTVFAAYVRGLRDGGWHGDARAVRLAMCASAVKYDWLAALMLTNVDAVQLGYGRERSVDVARRYAERGAALMFLDGWVTEALELARELSA